MSDSNKKEEIVSGGISPIVAAVAGAVVGAGAVIVSALTMDKGKAEDKAREVIDEVKKKTVGYVEDIKEKAVDSKEDLKKALNDAGDMLRDEAEKAKKEVKKTWKK